MHPTAHPPHARLDFAMRVVAGFVILAALPLPAGAQWHLGAYVGAATTQPAAITVRNGGTPARLDNVSFRSESFKAPIYYGYRVGRDIGGRGLGLEGELIHLKVIAKPAALGPPVEAFAMTHGMNFLLANLVWTGGGERQRVRGVARAGVGPTLPHAESRVAGRSAERYEWGGIGVQVAPGVAIRLARSLSLTAEYKFTFARPTVGAAGAALTTTVRSHHGALGIAATF